MQFLTVQLLPTVLFSLLSTLIFLRNVIIFMALNIRCNYKNNMYNIKTLVYFTPDILHNKILQVRVLMYEIQFQVCIV
jgi:hypothetical protein